MTSPSVPAANPQSLLWSGLLLAIALPRAAQAQAPELDWNVPAGCPRAAQVLQRVQSLVGAAPVAATPLRAEVSIERAADGVLHLHLVTRANGLTGERRVESRSCEDLANTVAIHLALLLQAAKPTAAEPGDANAPTNAAPDRAYAPAAHGVMPPATRDAHALESAVENTPRSVFGLLQLPVAAFGVGPLPHVTAGTGLAGGLAIARFRVYLEGQAWLAQQLSANGVSTLSAQLQRASVNVRACRAFGSARWELAPCIAIHVEHLWARGSGPHLNARAAQTTWLAAGVGAQARYAITSWLGILARADVQLELSRPRLSVDGLGTIGQLGPAALTLTLAGEWIL